MLFRSVSEAHFSLFFEHKALSNYADIKQGMKTADNNRFLRFWFEISRYNFCINTLNRDTALSSGKKWFPYNKGGDYRKWYGNQEYVVNWEQDGSAVKAFPNSVIRNESYYFREGLTWSLISSSKFGIRYTSTGAIFDGNGSSMFATAGNIYELLGFLTSKVAIDLLKILSPTMTFEIGQLSKLPYILVNLLSVQELVKSNIAVSRADWDSFETSWDFKRHPLV